MEIKIPKSIEITIPEQVNIFEDKRSKAKSIAFPFRFFNGDQAVVTITKLKPTKWEAYKEIESIKINFK